MDVGDPPLVPTGIDRLDGHLPVAVGELDAATEGLSHGVGSRLLGTG